MYSEIMNEVERIRTIVQPKKSLRTEARLNFLARDIMIKFLEKNFIDCTEDFVIFGLAPGDTILEALSKYPCLKLHFQSKYHSTYEWFGFDDKIYVFVFGGHEPEFDRVTNLLNIYLAYKKVDQKPEEVYPCSELKMECEKMMNCIKKNMDYEVADGSEAFVYKMDLETNFTHYLKELFQTGHTQQKWKRYSMLTWKSKKEITVLFLFYIHMSRQEVKSEKETILNELNNLRSEFKNKLNMMAKLNLKASTEGPDMIHRSKETKNPHEYIFYTEERDKHFNVEEMKEILRNERIDSFGVHCVSFLNDENKESYAWVYIFGEMSEEQQKTRRATIKRKDLTSKEICEIINCVSGLAPIENAENLNEEAKSIYEGLINMEIKITTNDIVCLKTDEFSADFLMNSDAIEYIMKFDLFGYHHHQNFWILVFDNEKIFKGTTAKDKNRISNTQRGKCIHQIINLYRDIHSIKRLLKDTSMEDFIRAKMKELTRGEIVTSEYNILTLNCNNFEEGCNTLLCYRDIINPKYTYCGIVASDSNAGGKCSLAIGMSEYAENQRKYLITAKSIILKYINEARQCHQLKKLKTCREMEKLATKRLENVLNNRPSVNDRDENDFACFALNDQLEIKTCMIASTDLYLSRDYKEVGIAQVWSYILIYFSPKSEKFNRNDALVKLHSLDGSLNVQKTINLIQNRLKLASDSIRISLKPEPRKKDSKARSEDEIETEYSMENNYQEERESHSSNEQSRISSLQSELSQIVHQREDIEARQTEGYTFNREIETKKNDIQSVNSQKGSSQLEICKALLHQRKQTVEIQQANRETTHQNDTSNDSNHHREESIETTTSNIDQLVTAPSEAKVSQSEEPVEIEQDTKQRGHENEYKFNQREKTIEAGTCNKEYRKTDGILNVNCQNSEPKIDNCAEVVTQREEQVEVQRKNPDRVGSKISDIRKMFEMKSSSREHQSPARTPQKLNRQNRETELYPQVVPQREKDISPKVEPKLIKAFETDTSTSNHPRQKDVQNVDSQNDKSKLEMCRELLNQRKQTVEVQQEKENNPNDSRFHDDGKAIISNEGFPTEVEIQNGESKVEEYTEIVTQEQEVNQHDYKFDRDNSIIETGSSQNDHLEQSQNKVEPKLGNCRELLNQRKKAEIQQEEQIHKQKTIEAETSNRDYRNGDRQNGELDRDKYSEDKFEKANAPKVRSRFEGLLKTPEARTTTTVHKKENHIQNEESRLETCRELLNQRKQKVAIQETLQNEVNYRKETIETASIDRENSIENGTQNPESEIVIEQIYSKTDEIQNMNYQNRETTLENHSRPVENEKAHEKKKVDIGENNRVYPKTNEIQNVNLQNELRQDKEGEAHKNSYKFTHQETLEKKTSYTGYPNAIRQNKEPTLEKQGPLIKETVVLRKKKFEPASGSEIDQINSAQFLLLQRNKLKSVKERTRVEPGTNEKHKFGQEPVVNGPNILKETRASLRSVNKKMQNDPRSRKIPHVSEYSFMDEIKSRNLLKPVIENSLRRNDSNREIEKKKLVLVNKPQLKQKPPVFTLPNYQSRVCVKDLRNVFQNKPMHDASVKRNLNLPNNRASRLELPSLPRKQVSFTMDSSASIEVAMNKIKTEHGDLVKDFTTVSIAKDEKSNETIIAFTNDPKVDNLTLSTINKHRQREGLENLMPSKRLCEICLEQLEKGYESKTLDYGLFDSLFTIEAEKCSTAFVTFSSTHLKSESIQQLVLRKDFKYFGMASVPLTGKESNVWGFCFTCCLPK